MATSIIITISKDNTRSRFPDGYWDKWLREYGHDFLELHWERSVRLFGAYMGGCYGKDVLEVGGYPGLNLSLYLSAGARVTAIDSPKYRPEHYLDWCKSVGIESVEHDIVQGAPPIVEKKFDLISMSDVLIHITGVPVAFLEWCAVHAKSVVLVEYYPTSTKFEEDERVATDHSLRSLNPLASDEFMKRLMGEAGLPFAESRKIPAGDGPRNLMVFGENILGSTGNE